MLGAQTPNDLDPTHAGHHQVDHDDVGNQVADLDDGGLAARRLADDLEVVEPGEARGDTLTKQVVIVDHDDANVCR